MVTRRFRPGGAFVVLALLVVVLAGSGEALAAPQGNVSGTFEWVATRDGQTCTHVATGGFEMGGPISITETVTVEWSAPTQIGSEFEVTYHESWSTTTDHICYGEFQTEQIDDRSTPPSLLLFSADLPAGDCDVFISTPTVMATYGGTDDVALVESALDWKSSAERDAFKWREPGASAESQAVVGIRYAVTARYQLGFPPPPGRYALVPYSLLGGRAIQTCDHLTTVSWPVVIVGSGAAEPASSPRGTPGAAGATSGSESGSGSKSAGALGRPTGDGDGGWPSGALWWVLGVGAVAIGVGAFRGGLFGRRPAGAGTGGTPDAPSGAGPLGPGTATVDALERQRASMDSPAAAQQAVRNTRQAQLEVITAAYPQYRTEIDATVALQGKSWATMSDDEKIAFAQHTTGNWTPAMTRPFVQTASDLGKEGVWQVYDPLGPTKDEGLKGLLNRLFPWR